MKTLLDKAQEAIRAVREAPVIAYDTESSGLDWKRNHPVGYVITVSENDNWYIPVRHGGGANLSDPECPQLTAPDDPNGKKQHWFEKELADAFASRSADSNKLTIGHNIKFDMHMSANSGILLGRNCEDTQINEALIDEYTRGFGLEDCAKRHKVALKKGDELYQHLANKFGGEPDRKLMEHFWKLPGTDAIGTDYAMGDGISTLELRAAQVKELLTPDEYGYDSSYIHNLERQLIWSVFRMERKGIRIAEERIPEVQAWLDGQIREAQKGIPKDLNVRSRVQMQEYMESLGRTDWPTTEKGNASFTEKWLETFPEGEVIVRARKLTNLINSFLTPLAENHMWMGRVHSSLNQAMGDEYGTVSGRFSCNAPNLQQVPKRNKELAKIFRSLFLADDGMEFYECDYSQCEPRLFAHYSGDENLVKGYNMKPFKDAHAVVSEMLQVERDPTAKRMNMGIFTGMYPKTFAAHMGWELDRATAAWEAWHGAFPAVSGFQDLAKQVILDRGYVRTILGRICHLDDRRFAYRATSKIIQGSNADIIKYKMLEADKYLESQGDEAQLLMTVHDAFQHQVPKGAKGERIAKELVEIWCDVNSDPINLSVPFTMDVGHGPDWATATFGGKK